VHTAADNRQPIIHFGPHYVDCVTECPCLPGKQSGQNYALGLPAENTPKQSAQSEQLAAKNHTKGLTKPQLRNRKSIQNRPEKGTMNPFAHQSVHLVGLVGPGRANPFALSAKQSKGLTNV